MHRGLDVIRKEAWPFYRTISGVRLYWELEEPKGPKGSNCPGIKSTLSHHSTRSHILGENRQGETTASARMASSAPRCTHCGKQRTALKRCSVCKHASHCGSECQNAGWKTHMPTCAPPLSRNDLHEKVTAASAGRDPLGPSGSSSSQHRRTPEIVL